MTDNQQELNNELTLEQIENELFYFGDCFPAEAVQAAIEQQSSITPKLMACLNKAIEDVRSVGDNDIGHLFAVFLLSQFQEKSAFELIIRLARLSEEDIDYLIGDCLTDDLHRFIASTYNGDLQAIKNLIEDTQVNLWSRSAGIDALIILTKEGKLELDETVLYLSSLFTHPSLANNADLIAYLILACCALDSQRFYEEIQNAFGEHKVDPFVVNKSDIEQNLTPSKVHENYYTLIKDSLDEMQNLPWLNDADEVLDPIISEQVVFSNTPKTERNEPCPCDSGKKYKKCCLLTS